MRAIASTLSFVMLGAVAAVLTHTSPARAEGHVSTWLEARPYTCSEHLPSLAREITLACDASGGMCSIAPSEAAARRYVVLHCNPGDADASWSVEGTDEKGVRRWAATLAGPVEDRLRAAALWVVRAEGGEAPPPSAAPLPPTPPNVRPAAAESAADADTRKPSGATSGPTLVLAARGAVGYTKTADAGSVVGTGVMFGGHVIPELSFGVAASFDRVLDVYKHNVTGERASSGRAGLVLGLGAPFDAKAYGIQAEFGPGFNGTSAGELDLFWYVRGALTAQLFPTSSSRPYAAAAFTQESDEAGPLKRIVSLDLGIAWSP